MYIFGLCPDNIRDFVVSGNVFVIAAIVLERNLQSVANYLIVSLAVADLMVACLVMPLGAVYEVRNIPMFIKRRINYRGDFQILTVAVFAELPTVVSLPS